MTPVTRAACVRRDPLARALNAMPPTAAPGGQSEPAIFRREVCHAQESRTSEEPRMIRSHWTLALAALSLTAAGCGRRPAAVAAGADSAATPAAADSTAPTDIGPTRVEGFQNPESAKYDAELDVWYVSNVNGLPGAKDGNGYIS